MIVPISVVALGSSGGVEEKHPKVARILQADGQESIEVVDKADEEPPDKEGDDRIIAQGETQLGYKGDPYYGGRVSNNPKCDAKGYYSHVFEQDQWETQNWNPRDYDYGEKALKTTHCKSADVNARGFYTSHLAPCTFKFYSIEKDNAKDLDAFTMSTACQDAKPMEGHAEPEEYVVKWPDECVGDFSRCYLLDRDESILLRHMCKYDWKFPEGATHVSVDCTEDKQKKQEMSKNGKTGLSDPYLKHQQESQREFYAVILLVVGICLLAGGISLCCTYRYVIRPYLTHSMKRSRSDPELASLKKTSDAEKGV
jgi:hypothetical protein